jgi:hypothetical protein
MALLVDVYLLGKILLVGLGRIIASPGGIRAQLIVDYCEKLISSSSCLYLTSRT